MPDCPFNPAAENIADLIYRFGSLQSERWNNTSSLCADYVSSDYIILHMPLTPDAVSMRVHSYYMIPSLFSPLDYNAMEASGILSAFNSPALNNQGKGVLIGLVDTGIDYRSPLFQNPDGTTRIAGIWDQSVPIEEDVLPTGVPDYYPMGGSSYGTEYTREQINEALRSDSPFDLVPSTDETGHGTYAAALACGSAVPEEEFLGAAPEASIAVVKLKQAKQYLRDYYFIPSDAECYQETDLMLGIRYLNLLADSLNLPLVICFTVGSNMGGHIGTLPLPNLIENYGSLANHIAVIGTGNEADQRHHYANTLTNGSKNKTVEIRVGENVSGFSMELWTDIPNTSSISIISPSGEDTSRIPFHAGSSAELDFLFERTKVSVDYRILVEKTTSELVFFRFNSPAAGIWKIVIEPITVTDGQFHMWLPVTEFIDGEVYFLESDPYYTLTNPANTQSPVVVSYYNGTTNAVSQTSGRGYTRSGQIKPDLTAPGINIRGPVSNGRFETHSGSCAACAVTAGAVALMLEWLLYIQKAPGIDSFQIRSLLILGALRPDTMEYPNRIWGYGQLNLYHTFEVMRKL